MTFGGISYNPYYGVPQYPPQWNGSPGSAPDVYNPETDKLENTAALLSLGMFNVSTGRSSGSGTAGKSVDSTMRQYKRTVGAKVVEHGVNAALTAWRPIETTSSTGRPGTWDIAGRARQGLNRWVDRNLLPESRSVVFGADAASRTMYHASSKATWQHIQRNFNAFSPDALFGVGRNHASHYVMGKSGLELLSRDAIKQLSLSDSFKNITWDSWKHAVKDNWKNFRLMPGVPEGTKLTVGNYLKFGVGGNWARGIGTFMAEGKGVFGALVSSLQIAFLGVNTLLTARRQWKISEQNGDGFFTKLLKTVKAGGMEFMKTLVGYEIGALAYTAIYATVGIPFLGAGLALAGAATGGVLTALLWEKIFGKAAEPLPGSEDDMKEKQEELQQKGYSPQYVA